MDHTNERLFPEFPPVSTAAWEAKILEDLKGADYAKKLIRRTDEGFDLRPYYRQEDLADLGYLVTAPGQYPFVRGNNNKNSWEVRQDMDSTDPGDANIQALDALKRGATAIGFNVSNVGTAVHLEKMLKGLCLGGCSLHFAGAASYPDIASLLAGFLSKHHINKEDVTGSFDFDPISYLLLEGDFWHSEEADMGELLTLLTTGRDELPRMKMITVNGQYFRNAGSTIVQELAFSLASGNEYLAHAANAGWKVDEVAPRMLFSFASGSDYFMEIAKLRAARLLWARIVEQYKPEEESSMQMNIHTSTINFNKSLYDPYVNILRTTTEAMSAIIGGTGSLSITPFDAFYKDPDEFSNRIARNQQVILKEEAYLEKVVDPAAGSYFIENLTDSIAKASWELFRKVEAIGGMLAAIKAGFIQEEVKKQGLQRKQDVATRKTVVLGTNQYPNLQESMLEKIQESDEADMIEEEMPEKQSTYPRLELLRLTDGFDDLRLETELYIEEGNNRPQVFLFTMGNLAMRKARAMFSTNFFGCAGYEVTDNPGFKTVEEGVKAVAASKAEIVVICSSDEEYVELAPAIAKQLKESGLNCKIILAGYPKEIIDTLKAAGIDDFIHVRTNVLEFLQKMNKALGISE